MGFSSSDKTSGEHHEVQDAENFDDPKAQNNYVDDYVPDTPEERALVRKIDLYILPTMWLMYLLSYMDRTK